MFPSIDLYKKILETTMTPTGIDTAKLYPILMSSGLPRETLGQIWALTNRTTPGKLTKEELYTVLAMIAVTQVQMTETVFGGNGKWSNLLLINCH